MAKLKTVKKPKSSPAAAATCHMHAAAAPHDHDHPDHAPELKRLARIQGQLQGVGRMIEAKRYCPDILVQTRAAIAAIKALEDRVLEQHLQHCVRGALQAKDAEVANEKIEELMELFRKRL